MVNRDEIIDVLRQSGGHILQEYKAEIEGIFGSYARGEERDDSDLDVLVNLDEKATLFDLVGLGYFLEEVLGCKVDIVSKRALREEIKPYVFEDLIPV